MTIDEQLQRSVLDELKWDPRVRSSGIGVIATEGAVTLTGEVDTYAEKLAAERAAQRVKGVRALRNMLFHSATGGRPQGRGMRRGRLPASGRCGII